MFTNEDLESLKRRGIHEGEARRQVALLKRRPAYAALERPCALGDGIRAIREDEIPALEGSHSEAALEGRCAKFVPASGAASRMFKDLIHYLNSPAPVDARSLDADLRSGVEEARSLETFIGAVRRFAFAPDLERMIEKDGGSLDRLLAAGSYTPILRALLSEEGLDYSRTPKGMIPFHAYAGGSRTPFEEHLVEAPDIVGDRDGECRLHFTVSGEHLPAFESQLGRVREKCEEIHGIRYTVAFSVQKPSTDTLALDDEGRPFRTADGALLLRPAGHGALLSNLAESRCDVVMVRNIDNVAHDALKPDIIRFSRAVIGLLVATQDQIRDHLMRLEDTSDRQAPRGAAAFLREVLNRESREERGWLADRLDRPLRVCGMVPNTGDPGGGPFWTRDAGGGLSLQIVEGSQVDPASEAQQRIYASASHINPVFMALGLRDHRGAPFDLDRFADPDAVIITRKSFAGRKLVGLERPGLWNGSMARWNTIFVEVPSRVFNPVKTVNDLLREAHRSR